MARTIEIVLVALGALYLFIAIVQSPQAILPTSATSQTAAVTTAMLSYDDFTATGTLVFYPSNGTTIPYLMYIDDSGHVASKSLVFSDGSESYYSWTGAHISITGHQEQEHVLVAHIRYVSGP